MHLRQLKCNDESAFVGGSHKHFFALLRLFGRSKEYLLEPHSHFFEDSVYNFLFTKHNDQHVVLDLFTKDARKVLTESVDSPRVVAIVTGDIYETLLQSWEMNHDLDKSYTQRVGDATIIPMQQLTSWYKLFATAGPSLAVWATDLYLEACHVHARKMRARCNNETLLNKRHHEDDADGDEEDRDTKDTRKRLRSFTIAEDMKGHVQRTSSNHYLNPFMHHESSSQSIVHKYNSSHTMTTVPIRNEETNPFNLIDSSKPPHTPSPRDPAKKPDPRHVFIDLAMQGPVSPSTVAQIKRGEYVEQGEVIPELWEPSW